MVLQLKGYMMIHKRERNRVWETRAPAPFKYFTITLLVVKQQHQLQIRPHRGEPLPARCGVSAVSVKLICVDTHRKPGHTDAHTHTPTHTHTHTHTGAGGRGQRPRAQLAWCSTQTLCLNNTHLEPLNEWPGPHEPPPARHIQNAARGAGGGGIGLNPLPLPSPWCRGQPAEPACMVHLLPGSFGHCNFCGASGLQSCPGR